MERDCEHYLGVDFGTSSSYLCVVPHTFPSPNAVHIDGSPVLPTAVLWEPGGEEKQRVKAFGAKAEQEWGMALPHEKKNWRLSTQFKPEISVSPQAEEEARAFLKSVAAHLVRRALLPSARMPSELDVLVGVPSTGISGYNDALCKIASAAGFGTVKTVQEPVGALIHHLVRRDIAPRDARSGLLVIDFGGGTCDVAYMLRLDVKHAWGDPLLGGRLFDDLFFQWFIEENPGVVDELESSGDEYYIPWMVCRDMKERFSETMNRDKTATFRFNVPGYGSLTAATWKRFEEKSRHFRPGEELLEKLRSLAAKNAAAKADADKKAAAKTDADKKAGQNKADLVDTDPADADPADANPTDADPADADPADKHHQRLLDGREVDLFAWFEDVITRGLRQGQVRPEDIRWIILTGGSSDWAFVKEMAVDRVGLGAHHVIQSANPRGAIGEGIGLLPVLQNRHQRSIRELKAEKHTKSSEITDTIKDSVFEFATAISRTITSQIIDTQIRPLLEGFRDRGGTLRDLKLQIKQQIIVNKDTVRDLVKSRSAELTAAISHRVTEIISAWFFSKDIHWEPTDVPTVESGGTIELPDDSVDPGDPYLFALKVVTPIVITTIISTVCGGMGLALIVAGPEGLLLGVLIGLVVSAVAWALGKEKARSVTESFNIPSWLSKRALGERKLKKIIDDSKTEVKKALLKAIENDLERQEELLKQFVDDLVMTMIDDLGVIDQL